MKICHITMTISGYGGAERMLCLLLMADPQAAEHKMVLTLQKAEGAWAEQLRAAGITVHGLGMKSILDLPRVFNQLRQFLRAFKPDIVQTWMYHADFLGGMAAYLEGFKNIIWGIRRTALSWSDSKSTLAIMKACALLSHRIPKKIVSVAEAGKKAHQQAGYDAARMVVIPNGFDFSKLTATAKQRNALRLECGFLEDDLVIGVLGRFHPAKGQDIFVKTAALMVNRYPKLKFLMVGEECDHNNTELLTWINRDNLAGAFVLLGGRDDAAVCLAAMDIYCMPSRTEGFPNSLGEAMAMGLPCVATEVGDTKVLVGDTVPLVPAQDEQKLAQTLSTVIELSAVQRHEMGLRARVRVTTEFSIERACERFNRVYNELLSEANQ